MVLPSFCFQAKRRDDIGPGVSAWITDQLEGECHRSMWERWVPVSTAGNRPGSCVELEDSDVRS